jgi:hypothetical protein
MKTKRAFLAAATIMLFLAFGSAAALKSTKAVHLRSLGVSQTHSKLRGLFTSQKLPSGFTIPQKAPDAPGGLGDRHDCWYCDNSQ